MDWILTYIQDWSFDIASAVITLVVAPIALLIAASLRAALKKWMKYALEAIEYWLNRYVRHSVAATATLKRYCRLQLAGSNKYLLVPGRLETHLEVDKIYVPLQLETVNGSTTCDHRDFYTLGSRVTVIGDPGSGKSSLIKRVFRDQCDHAIQQPRTARLPILVELRNLAVSDENGQNASGGSTQSWLYEHIRDAVCRTEVFKMDECFDNYVQTTGLMILLDGLDEVSSSQYEKITAEILMMSKYLEQVGDNNIILLTMRSSGLQFDETSPCA